MSIPNDFGRSEAIRMNIRLLRHPEICAGSPIPFAAAYRVRIPDAKQKQCCIAVTAYTETGLHLHRCIDTNIA